MYDGNAKYVARITLVKGVPFYGFHVGYQFYLKIYVLNPMVMTRLADILRQGAVMKKVFQPYEAHLQYLLQWMADYNLYGCGYVDCKKVVFRTPVPAFEALDNVTHLWHDRSVPRELMTDASILQRASHCSIEVDICVQDILNRHDIKPRPLHHDFIERLNPLPPDQKLVHSMAGLWRDEIRRRRSKMSSADPGNTPFPSEVMVSMSADPRDSQPGGWIHEKEYSEKIRELIADEKNKSDGAKLSFNSFVKQAPFESSVKTCLESVEDLYPENLRPALGLTSSIVGGNIEYGASGKDVDEQRLLAFFGNEPEGDNFPYDSDEEVMREMKLSQMTKGDRIEAEPVWHDDVNSPKFDFDDEGQLGPANSGDRCHGIVDVTNSKDPDQPPNSYSQSIVHPSEGRLFLTGNATLSHEKLYEAVPDSALSQEKRSASPMADVEIASKRLQTSTDPTVDVNCMFSSGNRSESTDHALNFKNVTKVPSEVQMGGRAFLAQVKIPTGSIAQDSLVRLSATETLLSDTRATERSQNLLLKFPIVKDPYDPSTMLRLSQKSASQTSIHEKQKRASFDQFLPPSQDYESIRMSKSFRVGSNSQILLPTVKRLTETMTRESGSNANRLFLFLVDQPPCASYVASTMEDFNLPPVIYQDAFYSDELDVPDRAREWAGREFKLEGSSVPFLPNFDPLGSSDATHGLKLPIIPDIAKEESRYVNQRHTCSLRSWEIIDAPPSHAEVLAWAQAENPEEKRSDRIAKTPAKMHAMAGRFRVKGKLSQVEGPTQKNKYGFKYTQKQKTTSVKHEAQYMSIMSLELHVNTRGNFVPNPEEDEIQCIFWCLQSDEDGLESNGIAEGKHIGIVVLSEDGVTSQRIAQQFSVEVQEESSELDLILRLVEIVRNHDPDILTGYEVHRGSWGYIIERARLKYEYNLCDEFSRMKSQSHGRFGKDNDR